MKKIIRIGLAVLATACGFAACKKDSHPNQPSGLTVTLSATTAKKGQPIYAATNVNTSGTVFIRWSVNPPQNSWISSSAGKSVLLFSSAGNYKVTASYFVDSSSAVAYDSSSSTIMVNDSVYKDTLHCDVEKTVAIDANDQVALTPLYSADTGLVLVAHTAHSYADVPWLHISFVQVNGNGVEYAFTNIDEYPCYANNGPAPALGLLNLGKLENGAYPLTLVLSGTTYNGSITVTDTQVQFTWPYNTGVTILPAGVNK